MQSAQRVHQSRKCIKRNRAPSIHPSISYTMKLLWFVVFLLALVYGAYGQECPKGFKPQQGQCVTQRPVHGDCPANSKYDLNKNLCVYT
ncbi:uncharacterized protein LOC118504936 [Anopheles stephensi]|uniref:uncharacterized protein LOC118504936 n=1 Tax=Anopheles stephensi TaxID=30069 RepID=UPI001658C142|nr:uncharacterized protein LOC118504936 [Anopheles stephensi]